MKVNQFFVGMAVQAVYVAITMQLFPTLVSTGQELTAAAIFAVLAVWRFKR